MIKFKFRKKKFNKRYLPYLNCQSKTQIFFGGAGSGKSVFNAQKILLDILKGDRNYLVIRKVYRTIEESVFNELEKASYQLGINRFFNFKSSPLKITCSNGHQILFRGMDDPEKVKSVTPKKGVITDIYIEEATEITEDDYNILLTRLRGKCDVIKRTHLSFNPVLENHWLRKRFFTETDEKFHHTEELLILKTTHKDNEFLDDQDHEMYEGYKDIDIYLYEVYTLGNWGVLKGLIFKSSDWEIADLSKVKDLFNTYYNGQDFGFEDPKAYVRVAVREKNIYILHEVVERQVTNIEYVPKILPILNNELLTSDTQKNDKEEFKQLGVNNIRMAKKGSGSVVFGIQWLKNYKIIIDKRCKETIFEFKSYKWKTDKDGKSTGEPLDKNNHCIDALRYALEDYMRNVGPVVKSAKIII